MEQKQSWVEPDRTEVPIGGTVQYGDHKKSLYTGSFIPASEMEIGNTVNGKTAWYRKVKKSPPTIKPD